MTLFLLFVIAVGVAAYLFWLGESRTRKEIEAARDYDRRAVTAAREITELRAAQQAYVAAGQGEQFWGGKVSALLAGLRTTTATLRTDSISPRAQSSIDNVAASLDDFDQMDRRARAYARTGQMQLASEVIFADGVELATAGTGAFDQARSAETQARDETLAAIRRRQLFALGSGGAAALLVTLLLLPRARSEEEYPAEEVVLAAPAFAEPAEALDAGMELEEAWSRPAPVSAASAELAASAAAAAPPAIDLAPVAAQEAAAPRPTVDLGSVASLCTDLARIGDTKSLPSLLERAAHALGASGIVVWIADPDGRELSPILTHGYSPHIVTRLGTILRDAENATAAAFRTSLLQTVKADAISEGAIAAPLVTPAGCVGVMAAEVRDAGENDSSKLAAATIVAAQLATLVGPPSSRAQAKAEAAG